MITWKTFSLCVTILDIATIWNNKQNITHINQSIAFTCITGNKWSGLLNGNLYLFHIWISWNHFYFNHPKIDISWNNRGPYPDCKKAYIALLEIPFLKLISSATEVKITSHQINFFPFMPVKPKTERIIFFDHTLGIVYFPPPRYSYPLVSEVQKSLRSTYLLCSTEFGQTLSEGSGIFSGSHLVPTLLSSNCQLLLVFLKTNSRSNFVTDLKQLMLRHSVISYSIHLLLDSWATKHRPQQ